MSNCSRNENFLKLSRVEFHEMHIAKKRKKKLGSPDSFRRYDKGNMPPFLKIMAPSLPFLGVTETIESATVDKLF